MSVSTLASAIIFFRLGDQVVVVALPTCFSPEYTGTGTREACVGRGRGKSKAFVALLHFGPIDFQSYQLPLHAVLRVLFQSALADEVFFVEMNHLAETEFVRRILL